MNHTGQVHVGQVLEVEIVKIAPFGLVVIIGGKVRAICPTIHLSDTSGTQAVAQIHKRFKPGQKLTMRVWEVKDDAIIMSNKKSMVQAEDSSIITSIDDAIVGKTALGVVSKISQFGLQIHFFNKVKGDIPMGVLVKQGVTGTVAVNMHCPVLSCRYVVMRYWYRNVKVLCTVDVEEAYRVGQVVRCVILQKTLPSEKHKNSKTKLLLGLDLGDTSNILREGSAADSTPSSTVADSTIANGDSGAASTLLPVLSGAVIGLEVDRIQVRLSDGSLGVLTMDHVCNSAAFGQIVARSSSFAVGKPIERAVVINSSRTDKTNTVDISLKPLFLAAAGVTQPLDEKISSCHVEAMAMPAKLSELTPGLIVVGYVWKVESYGVLVKFRDGLTALAPRPNVADRFINSPVGLFHVGDAVRCIVQRVDLARDRAIVSFKPQMVPPSAGSSSYLYSFLRDTYSAAMASVEDVSSQHPAVPDWRAYPIGSVVKCTVVAVKDYGTVLMCPDNVTMALCRSTKTSYTEGVSVDAYVLDIDFKTGALEVTLQSDVVSMAIQLHGKTSKKSSKKAPTGGVPLLVVGKVVVAGDICQAAKIVLIKERYLVTLLASGVVCFVMVADYHCPYQDTTSYVVGGEVDVRVERLLSSVMVSSEESSPFDHVTIGSLYAEESDNIRKQVGQIPFLYLSLSVV